MVHTRVTALLDARHAAVGHLDDDALGAHLADDLGGVDDVLQVVELVPHEVFGLAHVGRDHMRMAAHPEAQRLAGAVEHGHTVRAPQTLQHLGVEVFRHAPRQRAGEHHIVGALGKVVDLLQESLELLGGDHRAVLDDLRLARAGGVDDGRGGTRLAGDTHEVVKDVLVPQPLDDLLPSAAAHQAADDDRLAQSLESAGDVDALAAGQREALAGTVPKADLEVRHSQRLVDSGVGRDSDDHPCPRQRLYANSTK